MRVALDVPLPGPFDYRSDAPVEAGLRVIVPFGRRKMIGVVVDNPAEPSFDPKQIKPIEEVLRDLPPFDGDWLRLARFAAEYYQRPLGEVMLPTLPPPLRKPSAYQGKRSAGGPVARLDGRKRKKARAPAQADQPPALNDAQQAAVETLAALNGFKPVLLYGVTGSSKTEVYLRAAERVLAAGRQVLLMVPEINLTPQLEGALRARLEAQLGPDGLAVMHSGLSDGERLDAWSRAQRGQARMLLGTRMAIFAPLSELGLIIVDEEHDASYKQQDGLRYSARDLAVWRAHDLNVPVVLGSATPSLETWQHAERGRYLRLALPGRARASSLPAIKLVDTRRLQMKQGLSPQLLDAIGQRLERKEQSLIFLNRRGYAPVLHYQSCAWVSNCPRCTAFTVLHRAATAATACIATIAATRRRCRAPAPNAATRTWRRWGAAPSASRSIWPSCFPRRASCASTPTARAGKAAPKRCSRRCTRARSTSWWARRWWPRATTSRAWGWWVCSTPIPCCSRMISARPNACSRSSCRWLAAPAAIRTMARC